MYIMSKMYSIEIISFVALLFPGLASAAIDLTHIPLGDGRISTTTPQAGYVYVCTQPRSESSGATSSVPWIHGDTWNLSEKVKVSGTNTWPAARLYSDGNSQMRIIDGNGLPTFGTTGNFPIAQSDPAYQYDRNPNSIASQNISVKIPRNPLIATTTSCVPMGPIGIATNGVAIFNALDGPGRDAVAHEVQDSCGGHPERTGQYHYHGPSGCIRDANKVNEIIGYAFDGFGITSSLKPDGSRFANSDLDICHGTTSPIIWDGTIRTMYHYVMTDEYPYTVGCFRGEPSKVNYARGEDRDDDRDDHRNSPKSFGTGTIPDFRDMPDESAVSACNIASSSSSTTGSVARGARGGAVVLIQSLLMKLGLLQMPIGVTPGYFGKLTEDAVKLYQSQNNLPPVGIFGPRTKESVGKRCPPGLMKQLERGNFPPGLLRDDRDERDGKMRWASGTIPMMGPGMNERGMGPRY